MKREKFLWPLTQSHHRALVTARRVKEGLAATGADDAVVKEMAGEVQKLYDGELKVHFWDEEKMLALYEQHRGTEEPEPQRIRRDHRRLEGLLAQANRKNLLEFAELLTAHVRFEEDVLFGKIEKALSEVEKQSVGQLLEQAITQCGKPS